MAIKMAAPGQRPAPCARAQAAARTAAIALTHLGQLRLSPAAMLLARAAMWRPSRHPYHVPRMSFPGRDIGWTRWY